MSAWLATYSRADGTRLTPQFKRQGKARMVALNTTPPLAGIPLEAKQRGAARRFDGQLRDFDWAVHPDWEVDPRPIRPFIPAMHGMWSQNTHRDWALLWNAQLPVEPNTFPYRLTAKHQDDISRALKEAKAWTGQVVQQYPAWKCLLPETQPDTGIQRSYSTREAVNAAVWDVRRDVLLLYGFVSCILHNEVDWRSRPWDGAFVHDLECFGLLRGPKRGILLKPNALNEMTIRRWLDHDVPVHYHWLDGPVPDHIDSSYAPERIGAFDFDQRLQDECTATKRQKEENKCVRRAEGQHSGIQKKKKKKWYKQAAPGKQKIGILAAEGKRLAEIHVVNTQLSNAEGDIAVVELWKDADVNDSDYYDDDYADGNPAGPSFTLPEFDADMPDVVPAAAETGEDTAMSTGNPEQEATENSVRPFMPCVKHRAHGS